MAVIEVRSPVDGSVVGAVDERSEQDIDAVLGCLAGHQPEWAARPVDERARLLVAAAARLEDHVDQLATCW